MKDMFIPNLFDMPQRFDAPGGKTVKSTIKAKELRTMISALESVGLAVRVESPGHFTCHVSGREILNARKGRAGTYLARYVSGVIALTRKVG